MIKFENVTKIYDGDGGVPALNSINLQVKPGEFLSVVGASGAGKSTLLKLIYAEEFPTEGTVYFEGNPIDGIRRKDLPYYRRNIGTVFQDFKLLPKKTAYENVAYAMEAAGIDSEEIEEDVPQILEIVGLTKAIEKFPHQLSGGEQQRVALARALINKPKIILADEPTGNLDPVSSLDILNLLLRINALGTTVILASHDKYIIDKANKRLIVIEKGKIVCDECNGKYRI